jgi:hypothetical protein
MSPRLAFGTALLLLSVVHSEQRFGTADRGSVFFDPVYQCAQFVWRQSLNSGLDLGNCAHVGNLFGQADFGKLRC